MKTVIGWICLKNRYIFKSFGQVFPVGSFSDDLLVQRLY
jgi:hypothetical protein